MSDNPDDAPDMPGMPPMPDMPANPFSEQLIGWMGLNEMMQQMISGGFTEKQACYIVSCIITGALRGD